MLVEGFYRTHSRWHYLGNLLLFGVISEVPFDLFTTKELMNWRWNNVMFTLAFMLVTIWIVDVIREKIGDEKKWLWFLISIPVVAIMCLLAMFCSLDYDYNGILMAYFFYLFRNHPFPRILFGYLSVVKEPWALLGLGLTLTYNGEQESSQIAELPVLSGAPCSFWDCSVLLQHLDSHRFPVKKSLPCKSCGGEFFDVTVSEKSLVDGLPPSSNFLDSRCFR